MLHGKAQAEHDRHGRLRRRAPIPAAAEQTGPGAQSRPGHGWTVVLRRQPARIVDGLPQGGYADVFELICCDCGDDPGLDYRETASQFQRIRGPYPLGAGITAYEKHVMRHHPQAIDEPARPGADQPRVDKLIGESRNDGAPGSAPHA